MAFDKTRLVLVEGAGKLPFYKYETEDGAGTVGGAGYFDAAAGIMPAGTVVLVVSVDDLAAPEAVNAAGHLFVAANDGESVEVSPLTALDAPD